AVIACGIVDRERGLAASIPIDYEQGVTDVHVAGTACRTSRRIKYGKTAHLPAKHGSVVDRLQIEPLAGLRRRGFHLGIAITHDDIDTRRRRIEHEVVLGAPSRP